MPEGVVKIRPSNRVRMRDNSVINLYYHPCIGT